MKKSTYRTLRNLKFAEIVDKQRRGEKRTQTKAYSFVLQEEDSEYPCTEVDTISKAVGFIKTTLDHTQDYQETFKIFLVAAGNNIVGHCTIGKGTMRIVNIDMRVLVKTVLDSLAFGVILSHNHPSGRSKPSKADEDLTDKVFECLRLYDVELLDHIITTRDEYFSFKENGLI